ncbi:DEAD helicases superfamily protein, putative [Cordyceps militaris CM01]|uniref:Pre-mRNA-splicing factor n=1 Tax=Cordyceps militaris (strain CM01) TaxID=983644 RepID=G3JPQ9_CORMM|nr:DEAD helicases superfamily protein, putative [Cordyceps militaris CM01]EGX89160.1 DEAD helicases superfamily protein, putative [Cordyceps militaris CM01]
MPNAKRLKNSAAAKARAPTQHEEPVGERPTPAEVEEEEHQFVQVARTHWLKKTKKTAKVKVKNDVLKQSIWEVLERDGFQYKSLLLLESLQTLESYLWPGYTEEASNFHVLLMALIINVKRREHLETWSLFEQKPEEFSSFFRRVLSLTLDRTLPTTIRTNLLCFLIHAFQSLDSSIVRRDCAPLVSIGIWHNISTDEERDRLLDQAPQLKKSWRASQKRFDAGDDAIKARLRFERSWLYTLLLDFLSLLYETDRKPEQDLYCQRFTEFITDLQSQLPTRRYVNALQNDLNLLPAMRLSPMYNDEANGLFRDLQALLAHFTYFAIDDQTGAQLTREEAYEKHCKALGRLQRTALKHFKGKLTVLALSNYGSIDKREELKALLDVLTDEELASLAGYLGIRTTYPADLKLPTGRQLQTECMLSTFERKKTFQELAQTMSMVPTEKTLFDASFQRADSYDGSYPLALPKLNLQYLSAGDFLWRALVLYRCEAFYGIRRDIETALRRLKPESRKPGETHFAGTSKMAMPISKPAILEVVPALIGDSKPSMVKAEVSFDVRRLGDHVRKEWDSLRSGDVVFLLSVEPPAENSISDGASLSELEQIGVVSVRAAEVIYSADEKARHGKDSRNRDGKRRIELKLDSQTYTKDAALAAAGKGDVYGNVNLLLRRGRRENNFKPVLESIRNLVLSDAPLPGWLHEVFLGYGDPAGASYKTLPSRIKTVDYNDTFLEWQHLIESLPGKTVEPSDDVDGSFGPPYVLETLDRPEVQAPVKASKKRRRDAEPVTTVDVETLKVTTYKPPNQGPYPIDAPKLNSVRFTPAQVEAIISGSQPGLTVVIGPPGTGKTDVATQIIHNIYHNFPKQKTLLIAHSNQALNQLFAKIIALDIDERHLLRLGHGEEELAAEGSFSKHGRVDSFLDNRARFLFEVRKLASSLGAPGAHDNSAETAGYFNTVYIQPAWKKFEQVIASDESSVAQIIDAFPFHIYFGDAPQPLFPPEAERAQIIDIAQGCYRHIAKVFSELADILPFEILRRERDKANYLLTTEARIVAMTTTHAAIRRGEIAALGFHYDNVVMEEAAQITEIESFIPLAMQKPVNGKLPLQRVVLCGDHLQNSPVIQSLAFRHYANLEQSLFSRFVRLGVPTISLDQQGRARPSIARLYQWRYSKLDNLPKVSTNAEFKQANAGFKFDFQFINVPNYKGKGEMEPTPHFIQNLGEAEYAVAIYQYMRLLGYPADKISILTTYSGQRALVRDVLSHRCARNPIFGMPKAVATVDKYQGEQNDYVILSLTRTSRVGYLRDVRRMTVAMSRARLGLYILGRREIFEACHELRPAFDILLSRPDKLMLVTGELWPAQRPALALEDGGAAGQVENEVVMEGVEHLGQYVFEMTSTKAKQLESENKMVDVVETIMEEDGEGDEEEQDETEATDYDGVIEPDIQNVREAERNNGHGHE